MSERIEKALAKITETIKEKKIMEAKVKLVRFIKEGKNCIEGISDSPTLDLLLLRQQKALTGNKRIKVEGYVARAKDILNGLPKDECKHVWTKVRDEYCGIAGSYPIVECVQCKSSFLADYDEVTKEIYEEVTANDKCRILENSGSCQTVIDGKCNGSMKAFRKCYGEWHKQRMPNLNE